MTESKHDQEIKAGEPVKITDAMAYAFHQAIGDGSLGASEVEEIKRGLAAAFADIEQETKAGEPVVFGWADADNDFFTTKERAMRSWTAQGYSMSEVFLAPPDTEALRQRVRNLEEQLLEEGELHDNAEFRITELEEKFATQTKQINVAINTFTRMRTGPQMTDFAVRRLARLTLIKLGEQV